MGRRGKVKRAPGYYVERSRGGQFKNWTSIPKGIRVDTPRKAKQKGKKPGYGHLKDYGDHGVLDSIV